jgi:hypothetical protein
MRVLGTVSYLDFLNSFQSDFEFLADHLTLSDRCNKWLLMTGMLSSWDLSLRPGFERGIDECIRLSLDVAYPVTDRDWEEWLGYLWTSSVCLVLMEEPNFVPHRRRDLEDAVKLYLNVMLTRRTKPLTVQNTNILGVLASAYLQCAHFQGGRKLGELKGKASSCVNEMLRRQRLSEGVFPEGGIQGSDITYQSVSLWMVANCLLYSKISNSRVHVALEKGWQVLLDQLNPDGTFDFEGWNSRYLGSTDYPDMAARMLFHMYVIGGADSPSGIRAAVDQIKEGIEAGRYS